jgi:N-acetylneuraminic acid mutarotase
MHTPRNGHAAAVVNGKVYVIGGEPSPQASLGTVEEYDPTTDTWTWKAEMPTKRTFLCACAVEGKIYAFGGVTAGVPRAVWNPATLDVYDPAIDTWTTGADMPISTCLAGACVENGRIYVMGGVPEGLLHDPPVSIVQEYDPATDTWTRKADMPTARSGLCLCASGGRVYAIGGGAYGGAASSSVEAFDPESDGWTAKPGLPTGRLGLSAAFVDGRIYAIGGARDFHPASGLSTVEAYDATLGPGVSITWEAGMMRISWRGILQVIDALDGSSWQDSSPRQCPLVIGPYQAAPMQFYRAREL